MMRGRHPVLFWVIAIPAGLVAAFILQVIVTGLAQNGSTAGVILAVTLIYFFPSIVAWGRKNHASAIFALNLLLGWTGIGWVVALVMALWTNNAKPADGTTAH